MKKEILEEIVKECNLDKNIIQVLINICKYNNADVKNIIDFNKKTKSGKSREIKKYCKDLIF